MSKLSHRDINIYTNRKADKHGGNSVSELTTDFNQPLNPTVTRCQPTLCGVSATKQVFRAAIHKLCVTKANAQRCS